jgi:hypothetical protein
MNIFSTLIAPSLGGAYENLNTAAGEDVSFDIAYNLEDRANLRLPRLLPRQYFKEGEITDELGQVTNTAIQLINKKIMQF